MSDATAYSCPQCHAALHLDPDTGKLACTFCGGSFDVSEIERKVDAGHTRKKAKSAAAKKHQKQAEEDGRIIPFDLESLDISRWDELLAANQAEQFEDVVGYTCQNCGAQVVSDKLTVATSCQYCGSNVVVDERVSGGLKPGYVIPFKIKAERIPQMLTDFYSHRPLLPKDFFYKNQVGQVQGIYVPFWLYDGVVTGSGSYEWDEVRSYYSSGDDVTETTRWHAERKGEVVFDNVPVDASVRIDDDLMDSIEPFRWNELRPFQPGYLTGFVAERFDQSPREVFARAEKRMTSTASYEFKSSVTSKFIKAANEHFDFSKAAASYVLLPVYLFNCRYAGKHYRYAVNGQTGEVVGEVPTGFKESVLSFFKGTPKGALITAIVTGLLAAFYYLD